MLYRYCHKKVQDETYMEDLKSVVSNVIFVSTFEVMDTDEQTVVHNVESGQQFHIPLGLFHKQMAFLRSEFQLAVAVDPVEILLSSTRVVVEFLVTDRTSQSRALQIICLMDIPVGGKDVAHHHKVDLASMRQLDTMQSKESAKQGMWVLLHMLYRIKNPQRRNVLIANPQK